jgi:hypothetical protein
VQASLSLQFFCVCAQPLAGAQVSVVQELLSSQSVGPPDLQEPALQVSPVVQALLSLQGSVLGTWMQAPSLGLHVSSVQTLLSLQILAAPATQVPALLHLSAMVQPLPSSQVVFVARFSLTHWSASKMLQ